MLAFALVFFAMVETSISAAFVGASLAWVMVSMATLYVWRKLRLTMGECGE
jgi:hypothetical protein